MSRLEQYTLAEIKSLGLEDRLEAADELWNSIASEQAVLPLSDQEKRLLDFAARDLAERPESGVEWTEFKERLLNQSQS